MWCGSLDRCMDDFDNNFVHCQGKVRPGETCPYPFTSVTHVEGDLVVRGDADLGGGVLHVSGPCNTKDSCMGSSDMEHPGGNVRVDAGEAQGLWQNGGSVEISAGTGSHQNSGRGGSVRISGGHAAGMFTRDGMNDGGDIQLVSGSASKGRSGSVLVQTGFSEATSSGEIVIATSNAGERGETGSLTLKTGISSEGASGDIKISSGEAHTGNPLPWTPKSGTGGSIHITVGTGDDGDGGNIKILSGSTTATSSIKNPFQPVNATGGSIEYASGASYAASSGEISISTADAGLSGVSGHLRLKTGEATSGAAGYIGLVTGNSTDGEGGAIELVAGSSAETAAYSRRRREGADGPLVQLKAGDAASPKSTGGKVIFFAGHGTHDDRWDGGNGGSIELIAGGGYGRNTDTDTGGDVSITGGASAYSKGGSLLIKSGPSLESSSGNVTIATDNSARLGVSGTVNISTGLSRWGDSGNILMFTGTADKYGHGGNIHLEVGNTEDGDGGNITAIAGPSSAMFSTGGSVNLQGGKGRHRSVHDGGDGGSLVLSGGKSYGSGFHDDGGSVNITAGASRHGDGGNVSIASGSSDSKSSGHLRIISADAGASGVSGDMSFGTGVATSRFDHNHDGHCCGWQTCLRQCLLPILPDLALFLNPLWHTFLTLHHRHNQSEIITQLALGLVGCAAPHQEAMMVATL